MNCPRGCKRPAIQDPRYGVLPCAVCQEEDRNVHTTASPEFYSLTKQDRVQDQRDHFAGDMAQPFVDDGNRIPNRVFYDLYPEQRDTYYTSDDLKKME